ncbi:MAG: AmmeMemoRadiSam system protein A [Minisyncoccales bacterium]
MKEEKFLILLAQKAIWHYLKTKEKISLPAETPAPFLKEKKGVFVSLKKEGKLRGCVGTFLPTKENIAQEVIENAILAAFFDNRFPALREEEIPLLSLTIYILEEPQLVKDLSELDPQKYGILVKSFSSNKTGLLLPDIKEIKNSKEQIFVACQKAGIDPLKEKFLIFKFSAQKYEDQN